MQVDFSRLARDAYGAAEVPTMLLMKPHGEPIGYLGRYFAPAAEFKFAEPSTIQFYYPKMDNGEPVPFYDELVKDKLIRIDPFGIFVVASAEEENDGVRAVKSVQLYSREYELAAKKVVLAEGTYNFWNPADPENSILTIVLANSRSWKVGYVSSSLIGRYRTFDETSAAALEFLEGTVQESYGCYFLFDTYERTVNAVSVDDEVPQLPIYLSYVNLLKSGTISELEDDFKTRYDVRGADGVTIRNVNPTGDNRIYNLDYAISNGDLPSELAGKWIAWQNAIFTRQTYYTSLVALRNTALAQQITETARLTDLKNQLATLDEQRISFLQMQSTVAEYSDDWNYFQERMEVTGAEYKEIQQQIADQNTLLTSIQSDIDGHNADIAAVNEELQMKNYFTEEELDLLDPYFKDGEFADATFAVFDVDVTTNDTYTDVGDAAVQFTDVTWTDVECDGGHRMAAIVGGTVTLTGDSYSLTGAIVSGTLDHKDGSVICSLYLGAGVVNGESFPSGTLTCVCEADYDDDALLNGMTQHEDVMSNADKTVIHIAYFYTGNATFVVSKAAFYFTRNVTEYQQYVVEQELYDYATERTKELSSPTYEFDIESGNILYAQEFEPFKNALQLGCKCYLDLDDDLVLTPILIEVHVDFFDPTKFSLVFANQFRRPGAVNTMKDIIKSATATSRDWELSKLGFGENDNTTTFVKEMIAEGLDASMTQVNSGGKSLVTIDETGITVDSEDDYAVIKMRNGMICIIDKDTQIPKLAAGYFYNPATGVGYSGVNCDVLGGTLVAGQNMIIECPDPNGGVMQFKVDSSGVILNNGRMYLRTDEGAMGMDARHGFFEGVSNLFETTDEGFVKPICIDDDGNLILDSDGFPEGVNVWIGIDGKVYIRGNIYAEDGVFNGTVYAKSGKFEGIVQASDFLDASGKSMMDNGKWSSEYLDVRGLNVNNNFIVDENGNVTINGGSISWSAVTGTDEIDQRIEEAYQLAYDNQLPSYIKSTYIDGTSVSSPAIRGGIISGAVFTNLTGTAQNPSYTHRLVMESASTGSYGTFRLYNDHYGDVPYFSIYDGTFGEIGLIGAGVSFLGMQAIGNQANVTPYGVWDFSNATVTGITATWA